MRTFISLLLCIILGVLKAQASVIYVNLNATGNGDGNSWANGFTDFQLAIDGANSGDSIFVATAVYQPASGSSFSMKEGVKIFGGFIGTESSFTQRSLIHKATLLGNDNSVIINNDNNLTAAAELDGFIITGGKAVSSGGGMYNKNVSPVIRNCIFKNNSTSTNGSGGGMDNDNADGTSIINCLFTGNSAGSYGGGMSNDFSAVNIINCVFWGNSSSYSAGAIYNLVASPVITNTVIWGNTATTQAGGLLNGNSARPKISFCNIQDQVYSGTGNISQDPLFSDPANGNFTLQNLSPCINAGDNDANPTVADLAGNPRIMAATIDMGVLERSPVKYVNLNATGTGDGSNWTNAYTHLQPAIDGSIPTDSIFVAQATYQPASGTSFMMKEGVKIFGGFTGTESAFEQRSLVNKAILKGNGSSVIFNDDNALTAAAELDGFIITGGLAASGGGMYNNNVSPVIRNCIFEGNSTPAIGNGGAMYNENHCGLAIINCIFTNNTAAGHGAGINNSHSDITITNCVFSGNSGSTFGSAMYMDNSSPVITNTIIWGNTAQINGNGLYSGSNADPVISYCNIQDEAFSGTNNISTDPLFNNAAGEDYTLKSGSPCLNTGDNAANSASTDIIGNSRIIGSAIDMGAYEFQGSTVPVHLVNFSASIQNAKASLLWHSGAETDVNQYMVEKSLDGMSFVTIARITAKGSNSSYSYRVAQTESVAYYRLHILDNSNKSVNSDIIRLSQSGQAIAFVYPNPAEDYLYLSVKAKTKIFIYNASGILVKSEQTQTGVNKINIRSLGAGIYFIRGLGEEIKFIKR